MNTAQLVRMTEDEAREYFERVRWPNGPICPHCGSQKCVKLEGKSTRPGVYKCKESGCRKQFTVTVGTVFHRSKTPLRDWLYALAKLCSSKKGYSAKQLSREIGVTYKCAWHMLHRIRHAMENGELGNRLRGTVEVDETYVGGKPRYKGHSKAGRGTRKQPVVAMVERQGRVKTRMIEKPTSKTLKRVINAHVDKSARLMTDEYAGYKKVGSEYSSHDVICHKKRHYVDGDITTNTVEGFFSFVKRAHYGVYHSMSKKHMRRYLDEIEFRYNNRELGDVELTEQAITQMGGKVLPMKKLIAESKPEAA